jgi:hypothetical protein
MHRAEDLARSEEPVVVEMPTTLKVLRGTRCSDDLLMPVWSLVSLVEYPRLQLVGQALQLRIFLVLSRLPRACHIRSRHLRRFLHRTLVIQSLVEEQQWISILYIHRLLDQEPGPARYLAVLAPCSDLLRQCLQETTQPAISRTTHQAFSYPPIWKALVTLSV